MPVKKATVRKTNPKNKAEATDRAPAVKTEAVVAENANIVETAVKPEAKEKDRKHREEELPVYLL